MSKLKPVQVFLAVGTGDERLLTGYGLEKLVGPHRKIAIELMKIAQKKDFVLVMTEKERHFLKKAKTKGVKTEKIIFLEHFSINSFYDVLHKKGVHPYLVIAIGHFRDRCMKDALEYILSMKYKNGFAVEGKKPKVKYIIGTASVPHMRDHAHDMDIYHVRGVEPITIQQFMAMDTKGKYIKYAKEFEEMYFSKKEVAFRNKHAL